MPMPPRTEFVPPPSLPPYAAEMAVSGLRTAEAFLLTALRLWQGAHLRRTDLPGDWRDGFLAAGLEEDAAPDFDMALRILQAGAKPGLALREPRNPRISLDEACLLRVFAHLQRGDVGAALVALQHRLPGKSLRWMLRYARSAAGALAVRGLMLPDRALNAVAVPARSFPVTFVDRGAVLLH
jgi:hypothetical protein